MEPGLLADPLELEAGVATDTDAGRLRSTNRLLHRLIDEQYYSSHITTLLIRFKRLKVNQFDGAYRRIIWF